MRRFIYVVLITLIMASISGCRFSNKTGRWKSEFLPVHGVIDRLLTNDGDF